MTNGNYSSGEAPDPWLNQAAQPGSDAEWGYVQQSYEVSGSKDTQQGPQDYSTGTQPAADSWSDDYPQAPPYGNGPGRQDYGSPATAGRGRPGSSSGGAMDYIQSVGERAAGASGYKGNTVREALQHPGFRGAATRAVAKDVGKGAVIGGFKAAQGAAGLIKRAVSGGSTGGASQNDGTKPSSPGPDASAYNSEDIWK